MLLSSTAACLFCGQIFFYRCSTTWWCYRKGLLRFLEQSRFLVLHEQYPEITLDKALCGNKHLSSSLFSHMSTAIAMVRLKS